MPDSVAQHHLGPSGVSELVAAANQQAQRLQNLMEDAVAARQQMLQNSHQQAAAGRSLSKQATVSPRQLLGDPVVTGLLADTPTAVQSCLSSIGLAAVEPETVHGPAVSRRLAAVQPNQQAEASLSKARSPERLSKLKAVACDSPQLDRTAAQRASLLSLVDSGLDALRLDTDAVYRAASPSPPRQWTLGLLSGPPLKQASICSNVESSSSSFSACEHSRTRQMEPIETISSAAILGSRKSGLAPSTHTMLRPCSSGVEACTTSQAWSCNSCTDAEGVAVMAGIAGLQHLHTDVRGPGCCQLATYLQVCLLSSLSSPASNSSRRRPSAVGSLDPQQQQRQEGMQGHPVLPPRVRLSEALKQQLLVEPSDSPHLLPHTHSRANTLLSAVPDPLSGGVDLDPHLAAMGWQNAGYGGYAGSAEHMGSWAQQMLQQGPTSPRVVVLPRPSTPPCDAIAAPMRCSRVGSCSSQQQQQGLGCEPHLGRRSGMFASTGVPDPSSPHAVVMTNGQPRRSQSNTRGADCRSRGASSIGACPAEQSPAAAGAGSNHQQQQHIRLASPQFGLNKQTSGSAGCMGALGSASSASAATHSSQIVPGVSSWHRSDSDPPKPADAVGPLELDPAAPPLGNMRLSRPNSTDMGYALSRWSLRYVI